MYTLRILTETSEKDGKTSSVVENFNLGENYSVYGRYSKEGLDVLETSTDQSKDNFRCLLVGEKGPSFRIEKMDLIGNRKRYYVMTENGKTFESLNYE